MKIVFHNVTKEAKPVRFAIDGGYGNQGFDGFVVEGERWNGWLQPYVTHEVYLQIIAAYITPIIEYDGYDTFLLDERNSMLEWFEGDGYTHGHPHKDDKPDTSNGLYSVCWGYCWDTQSIPPDSFEAICEDYRLSVDHSGGGCSHWLYEGSEHLSKRFTVQVQRLDTHHLDDEERARGEHIDISILDTAADHFHGVHWSADDTETFVKLLRNAVELCDHLNRV